MTYTTAHTCMGITTAAASTFATTNIAGHAMVENPGGLTVVGSGDESRWGLLSPYFIGEMPVSELEFVNTMKRPGREGAPGQHPVTMVSYDNAIMYLKRRGSGLNLPTNVQWENAARGPAVNIPERMEEETGRFTPADVVEYVDGRFENLVFRVLGEIFTDPKAEMFQRLMGEGRPFFGWRVNGTPSGRLSNDEVWFDQEGTAPVDWGPKNAYGLFNMTGNVWEWVQDWYEDGAYLLGGVDPVVDPVGSDKGAYRDLRGGSWGISAREVLRVAYRLGLEPGIRDFGRGFRVAAPQDSQG